MWGACQVTTPRAFSHRGKRRGRRAGCAAPFEASGSDALMADTGRLEFQNGSAGSAGVTIDRPVRQKVGARLDAESPHQIDRILIDLGCVWWPGGEHHERRLVEQPDQADGCPPRQPRRRMADCYYHR